MVRSPDWPIFLANLAEARRAALPGPLDSNLILGQALVFHDSEPASYELSGPEKTRTVQGRGSLVLDPPAKPGLYSLVKQSGQESQSTKKGAIGLAWNFVDAVESDISDLGKGHSQARSTASRASHFSARQNPVELGLLLLALALGLANWLVLSRAEK